MYHHSEYTTSLQMLYEMILQSAVLEDFADWLFFGHASISNLSFSNWNIWKWMWSRCMEKILFRASMLFLSANRFVVKLISFPLFLLWDGVLFMASPSFSHVCFKGLTITDIQRVVFAVLIISKWFLFIFVFFFCFQGWFCWPLFVLDLFSLINFIFWNRQEIFHKTTVRNNRMTGSLTWLRFQPSLFFY